MLIGKMKINLMTEKNAERFLKIELERQSNKTYIQVYRLVDYFKEEFKKMKKENTKIKRQNKLLKNKIELLEIRTRKWK